jgi:hypothetical protein
LGRGASNGQKPLEGVDLSYSKILWSYTPQDQSGNPNAEIKTGWELQRAMSVYEMLQNRGAKCPLDHFYQKDSSAHHLDLLALIGFKEKDEQKEQSDKKVFIFS